MEAHFNNDGNKQSMFDAANKSAAFSKKQADAYLSFTSTKGKILKGLERINEETARRFPNELPLNMEERADIILKALEE